MKSRIIKRMCKEQAKTMTQEAYGLYDAIWTRRIRITPALLDHGRETVREINQKMPNFLTYDSCASPVDEVAADFGFESDVALVEFLLSYTPRGPLEDTFYEQLLAQHIGTAEEPGESDVPF